MDKEKCDYKVVIFGENTYQVTCKDTDKVYFSLTFQDDASEISIQDAIEVCAKIIENYKGANHGR